MSAADERDAAEERHNADLKYLDADWTDVLRELARFASDHELDAPLTIAVDADEVSVAVSGPAHAAWFDLFRNGHHMHRHEGTSFHSSWGELPSGAVVNVNCLADDRLPTAVAS